MQKCQVLCGISSNVQPRQSLFLSLQRIAQFFEIVQLSNLYFNEAHAQKTPAPHYVNAAFVVTVDQTLSSVKARFKSIELQGGQRDGVHCPVDIDLIAVNDPVQASFKGQGAKNIAQISSPLPYIWACASELIISAPMVQRPVLWEKQEWPEFAVWQHVEFQKKLKDFYLYEGS